MLLVQIPLIPTTTPSTSMLVRDSQINPTMPLYWILLWELIRHAPRPGSHMYEQTMTWKEVVSRIPPRYLSHKPLVHPLLNDKNMAPWPFARLTTLLYWLFRLFSMHPRTQTMLQMCLYLPYLDCPVTTWVPKNVCFKKRYEVENEVPAFYSLACITSSFPRKCLIIFNTHKSLFFPPFHAPIKKQLLVKC